MRGLAIVALLAAVFAGCASNDSSTSSSANVAQEYVIPDVPAVDAVKMLDLHAQFVRANGERAANLPSHESARQALLGYFADAGLETYRHNFTTTALADQANIVGIHWGQVKDQWVVVGGHYDTTDQVCAFTGVDCTLRSQSQGAYDDGSGTMLTVHLAQAFANVTTYYSIAFVAYDGEELGTQGAAAFVRDFVTGGDEAKFPTPYGQIKVVGDVDLDMIGLNWPGTWKPVNVMTNSEALYAQVLNNTAAQGFPDAMVARKDGLQLGSSDYARFWEVTAEQGGPIPTVFFISAFEEVALPTVIPADVHTPAPAGYYPFWHAEDTVETMRAMAYDPPADGVAHPNLEAGFQSTLELSAHMIHYLAAYPDQTIDAKVM